MQIKKMLPFRRRYIAVVLTLLLGSFTSMAPYVALANFPTADKKIDVVTRLDFSGFDEPLFAISNPSVDDTVALKAAVAQYMAQANYAGVEFLETYLKQHPDSAWNVALQTNLGLIHYRNGAFSSAIGAWEEAWKQGKSAKGREQTALVDRAYGELVRMHARLGNAERMGVLLDEGKDRPLRGQATEAVTGAREGLWVMRNDPGIAYLCGPSALRNVLSSQGTPANMSLINEARSGEHGFSLTQVQELADKAGAQYQMVKREKNVPLPLPVIAHWKVNHYAAVLSEANGIYHVQDPTFGSDLWVPKAVLDKESSGYFLIPKDKVTDGWVQVAAAEANGVYGMGYPTSSTPGATKSCDNKNTNICSSPLACPCKEPGSAPGGGTGMPKYDVHSLLVSLNVVDTPIGYTPPFGPTVYNTLTYNQREAGQPANFTFSNISSKWNIGWTSYIEDNGADIPSAATRYVSGGGYLNYSNFNYTGTNVGFYGDTEKLDGGVLYRTSYSPITYELRLKNGAKEIYSQSDGATSGVRKIFLKQVVDAHSKALTLNYDSSLRLTSVVDALGQSTTFSYTNSNPLLITQITDPFGRTAILDYDGGMLKSITDAAGMTSTFSYVGSTDTMASMATPYGTTIFSADLSNPNVFRSLVITDPYSNKERTEFVAQDNSLPTTDPLGAPAGFPGNCCLQYRNTFYWDKYAYRLHVQGRETTPNYLGADIKHWLHTDGSNSVAVGVLESVKRPLENRVWFTYLNQGMHYAPGNLDRPEYIGRILDDGTTSRTKLTRNSKGKVTCKVDPENTVTRYDYDTNEVDLLYVKRRTDSGTDCTGGAYINLRSIVYYPNSTYGVDRLVQTDTDANSHTTTYLYNTDGQVTRMTNALGHQTNYAYVGGYLQTITDPNNVVVATFIYDSVGRVKTVTNAANYKMEYTYDNLNRLTQIKYYDSTPTFVTFEYNKLDTVKITDRNGDVKNSTYDNVRHLITQNINTTVWGAGYQYYENGQPKYITDGVGNVTAYVIDAQSRVVQKQQGLGTAFTLASDPVLNNAVSHNTTYTYENSTSRLKSVTDALSYVTSYTYDKANRIKTVKDARNNVTTYLYNELGQLKTQVSPDSGTTNYTYYPNGNLWTKTKGFNAANPSDPDTQQITYTWDEIDRLKTIDYPGVDQDVTYTYDQGTNGKGHLTEVKGTATGQIQASYTYYPAGDLKTKTEKRGALNLLTQYSYDPDRRLASITYPDGRVIQIVNSSGQASSVSQNGTPVLSNITHAPFSGIKGWKTNSGTGGTNEYKRSFYPNGTLSSWDLLSNSAVTDTHTLTYDAYNNIHTIQYPGNSQQDEMYEYDESDRLTDATGEWGQRHYEYDEVGNREQQIFRQFNAGTQNWDEVFAEAYTPVSNSNRLGTVTTTAAGVTKKRRAFTYDGRGNIRTDNRKTYAPNGTTELTNKTLQLIPGNSDRLNTVDY